MPNKIENDRKSDSGIKANGNNLVPRNLDKSKKILDIHELIERAIRKSAEKKPGMLNPKQLKRNK